MRPLQTKPCKRRWKDGLREPSSWIYRAKGASFAARTYFETSTLRQVSPPTSAALSKRAAKSADVGLTLCDCSFAGSKMEPRVYLGVGQYSLPANDHG